MSGRLKQFLLEEEKDFEGGMSAALWIQMVSFALSESQARPHGGSRPRKTANKQRDYAAAHLRYMKKYFWPVNLERPGTTQQGPEQDAAAFQRRFRISRGMFHSVFSATTQESQYLRQGLCPDAVGRLGISPLLKVICALRQLSYGLPSDLSDDIFDVSETTASNCLEAFCHAVTTCFGGIYLRWPTEADITRIEAEFRAVGFPGCIGCLDCAGWTWKNCPKAWQGAMVGKDGEPTVRMEVICSLDLWIWSLQFGLPRAMNDLNILEVSTHFHEVLSGSFPPVQPSYTINGKLFDWLYYLTDGIYPQWKIFVKTLPDSSTRKAKLFCKRQEGVRKCVERVFGVLFRRFKALYVVSELWSVAKMRLIATCAVCLHNMIVEDSSDFYSSDGAGGVSSYFCPEEDTTDITFHPMESLATHNTYKSSDEIKIKGLHRDLTAALIEHIWNSHGLKSNAT